MQNVSSESGPFPQMSNAMDRSRPYASIVTHLRGAIVDFFAPDAAPEIGKFRNHYELPGFLDPPYPYAVGGLQDR